MSERRAKIKQKRKNFLHDLGMRWRIFIYLLGFTLIMIVLLWLFQIVYLEDFYERIKKDQIDDVYHRVVDVLDSETLEQDIIDIGVSYSVCIDVYTVKNPWFVEVSRIASAEVLADCIIHLVSTLDIVRYYNGAQINYPEKFMEIYSRDDYKSVLDSNSFLLPQENIERRGLVYSRMAQDKEGNNYFILLNSTITPISATVATLQMQLLVISFILILVALIISFMIARRLSRPISKLNSAAKEMAKGNLDGNFPAEGYKEISELADTLNYASSELARTDTLQKDIIANISHDIRTPLTMIGGYAEVMRDFPDDDHAESIDVIIRETNRLRDLVNDILDSSRIKAGVSTIDPQLFNFSAALSEFIDTYNHLIEPQGYRVQLIMEEDIWLNADRQRLLQAVSNMLNNALTHIGSDKLIIVRQLVRGKTMRLEIEDHGCGIAKEDLPHLWERYYRTDAPAKGNHGSGIGLSIVKGIMDMHGAKYGVNSEVGVGSTFWFEIEMTALPGSKWRMLRSRKKEPPARGKEKTETATALPKEASLAADNASTEAADNAPTETTTAASSESNEPSGSPLDIDAVDMSEAETAADIDSYQPEQQETAAEQTISPSPLDIDELDSMPQADNDELPAKE